MPGVEIRRVGSSGLRVSALGLGTITWGRETSADQAERQLRSFVAAGGTLVDTSPGYADGDSERLLGRLVSDAGLAGELVLATKSGISRRGGDRVVDISRRALLGDLDASLDRLGRDHVDLWQIHAWSDEVPLAETLSACEAALASGRVRYIGVSNHRSWQLALAAAGLRTVRSARSSWLIRWSTPWSTAGPRRSWWPRRAISGWDCSPGPRWGGGC